MIAQYFGKIIDLFFAGDEKMDVVAAENTPNTDMLLCRSGEPKTAMVGRRKETFFFMVLSSQCKSGGSPRAAERNAVLVPWLHSRVRSVKGE